MTFRRVTGEQADRTRAQKIQRGQREDRHEQQEDRTDLLAGPSRPEVDPARDLHVDEEDLRQDPAHVDLRHQDPGHFVFELNRIIHGDYAAGTWGSCL